MAVVGATGAVGQEMLQVLEKRQFPLSEVVPLASKRSEGKDVKFCGEAIPVRVLGKDSFGGIDLALFSAGAGISRELAPVAVDAGAVVVDNSSAFRMDPEIPLVVPEVNPEAIDKRAGIIANKNAIPYDELPPATASGIRIGTPALTSRGLATSELRQVGELIVRHDDVNKIAFTGSTEVGRTIRETTAGSGKTLTLELGGKSPLIVFDDADLDSAVEGVVDGIWFNQGQVCCAGSRLLVQESSQINAQLAEKKIANISVATAMMQSRAKALTDKAQMIALKMLGATLLLIGIIVFTYSHRLTVKIKSLTEVAERISLGDLEMEIETKSRDEIGELAEAIGRMQDNIRLSIERLRQRR